LGLVSAYFQSPGLTPWAILVPPLWGFQFLLTTRVSVVKL